MRIISKFKDYYDGAQGYGQDPKLVYVRETKAVKIDRSVALPYWRVPNAFPRTDAAERAVIGFCGRLYPFYVYGLGEKTCWTLDALISAIEDDIADPYRAYNRPTLEKHLSDLHERGSKFRRKWVYLGDDRGRTPKLNQDTWAKWLDQDPPTLDDAFFRYIKAPVYYWGPDRRDHPFQVEWFDKEHLHGRAWHSKYDRHVLVNPNLSLGGFAKIVDPWTAYQEVSMYLGNNLVEQRDPEVHVPDKIKAESRGFGDMSFRKRKK